MKYVKRAIPVVVLLAVIIGIVLLVHPVRVYSSTSYSYRIQVTGVKVALDGIGDIQGGYRCYLDDSHYIYLSHSECTTVQEDCDIYLQYGLPWELPILNRGGGR